MKNIFLKSNLNLREIKQLTTMCSALKKLKKNYIYLLINKLIKYFVKT